MTPRGGAGKGQGRHAGYRKPDGRVVRKGYRLTEKEDQELQQAVEASQVNGSDFVRSAIKEALQRSRRAIRARCTASGEK